MQKKRKKSEFFFSDKWIFLYEIKNFHQLLYVGENSSLNWIKVKSIALLLSNCLRSSLSVVFYAFNIRPCLMVRNFKAISFMDTPQVDVIAIFKLVAEFKYSLCTLVRWFYSLIYLFKHIYAWYLSIFIFVNTFLFVWSRKI